MRHAPSPSTLVAVLLLTAACHGATTPDPAPPSSSADPPPAGLPEMMSLGDEPRQPPWTGWTPTRPPADRVAPPAFYEDALVFDVHHLAPGGERLESVWTAASLALDTLQRVDTLPPTTQASLASLFQTLEGEGLRADVLFVAGPSPKPWEGLLFRFSRDLPSGARPALGLLVLRREGQPPQPSHLFLWARPGFEQAPDVTVALRRDEASWRLSTSQNLSLTAEELPSQDVALDALAEVLENRLWRPFIGEAYLTMEFRTEGSAPVLAAAESLEVRDRPVELVLRETVFPPRFEGLPEGF